MVSLHIFFHVFLLVEYVTSFISLSNNQEISIARSFSNKRCIRRNLEIFSTAAKDSEKTVNSYSFIDDELRSAAMKLHTKSQAPKEGEAPEKEPAKPYVTTLDDYLAFLVDSKYVYSAFERIISHNSELVMFQNTGLERTIPLEQDIKYLVKEYNLEKPEVGFWGLEYEKELEKIKDDIPTFLCHFYNHYFAHTAGGRMIGKQMSALLLNKKTLEFYKWDGDLNEIKARVKNDIEETISTFSREEKDACVAATKDTFYFGGGLNSYLSGSRGSSSSI